VLCLQAVQEEKLKAYGLKKSSVGSVFWFSFFGFGLHLLFGTGNGQQYILFKTS